MTRVCQICTHSKRLAIDRELVQGRGLTDISKKYDVNYQSLYAHSQNHISRQLAQCYEKKQLEEDFHLLDRIDQMLTRVEKIFRRNYAKKRDGMALKALSEQRQTFELLAKISYALHQAKLTELELAKQEAGEVDIIEEQRYQEKLNVLSLDELRLFHQLVDKIEKQDKSQKIEIPRPLTEVIEQAHEEKEQARAEVEEKKPRFTRTKPPLKRSDDLSREDKDESHAMTMKVAKLYPRTNSL